MDIHGAVSWGKPASILSVLARAFCPAPFAFGTAFGLERGRPWLLAVCSSPGSQAWGPPVVLFIVGMRAVLLGQGGHFPGPWGWASLATAEVLYICLWQEPSGLDKFVISLQFPWSHTIGPCPLWTELPSRTKSHSKVWFAIFLCCNLNVIAY